MKKEDDIISIIRKICSYRYVKESSCVNVLLAVLLGLVSSQSDVYMGFGIGFLAGIESMKWVHFLVKVMEEDTPN